VLRTVLLVQGELPSSLGSVECRVVGAWSKPHSYGWTHSLFLAPTADIGAFESSRLYCANYFSRRPEPSEADFPNGDEYVSRFKVSYDASSLSKFEPGDHFDEDFVASVGIHADRESLARQIELVEALMARRPY
jgi:hypothetical protein